MIEDISVRMAAALAKVDATPPPEGDYWEAEAGKWTFDPDSEPKGSPTIM